MKSVKKISIIVPMYNCESTIERCLDSILTQTYKNYEIILIDDGSSDNTSSICEKYKKKYNNIQYFSQTNSGPSSARLNGIHKANNEYIMFIDSDDYIDNNFLEKILNEFKEGYINGTNFKIIYNNHESILKRESEDIEAAIPDIFTKKIGGYCWGYLFEKDKIKDEYFDLTVKFMEDTLFLLNYAVNFKGFNFIDGVYYNYVYNKKSLSKSNDRIVENIISANYVINISEKNLKSQKIDANLFSVLFNIINSQMLEINKISDLKLIIFNDEVKKILNNFELNSLIYKLYQLCFKSNNCLPLYIYIRARHLLKKIYLKLRRC